MKNLQPEHLKLTQTNEASDEKHIDFQMYQQPTTPPHRPTPKFQNSPARVHEKAISSHSTLVHKQGGLGHRN